MTGVVRVRYFAAAAEAAGVDEELVEASTRGRLVADVVARHGDAFAAVLGRCSLVCAGSRLTDDDDAVLADGSLVDVLPPFAGG